MTALGPHFRQFWLASAISNLGDGIRWTALPLLTAAITRDPQVVAGTHVAIWAPQLLFGLIGGAVVDRVDRRLLVRNFQFARALVMAALAAAALADQVTVIMIYTAAFLIGTGEVFVDGAGMTIVRSLVSDDRLEDGYGKLWAADLTANEFIGPPVGGFLFGLARWMPFTADAASYALAGAFVHRLPSDVLARPERSRSTLRADIAEGLHTMWSNKLLRVLLLSVGAHNLLSSLPYAIYVLFALQVLDTNAIGFGLIMSAGGVGGVFATFVASRVMQSIGRGGVIWGGTIVTEVATFLTGFTSNPVVAGALQFVALFSISTWNVVGRALRASIVPDHLLGRVVSSGRVLGYGAIPVGSALGGWIAAHHGLRMPFFIAGALTIVVGLATIPWMSTSKIEAARAATKEQGGRPEPTGTRG